MNYQDDTFLKRQAAGHPPDLMAAEYGFLVGQLTDRETLRQAVAIARTWGVAPHEVLLVQGWITDADYVAALARHLGVVDGSAHRPAPHTVLLDGTAATPRTIAGHVAEIQAAGKLAVLVSPRQLHGNSSAATSAQQLKRAVAGLLNWRPVLSAGTPTWRWQILAIAILVGLVVGGTTAAPDIARNALILLLTLVFLPIVILRAAIAVLGLLPQRRTASGARIPDADLPVYSVLIPMFREGQVLPDLVAAISALDYPAAKLDVLLVLESVDTETQEIAASLDLPGFMRVIVVPDSQPRTKPKALNYALHFARGDYVVVYDAEDAPEPDQLRLAVATFRSGPQDQICLQGRLNIHNVRECWLTRQFALEYSVLFDITLPGLERLGLPIPLGGTSNHFPRAVLDRWIGWDPFNVTEDADLGIRLARTGGRIGILNSTTWEEAPAAFGVWLRQRTRWLKGWMQTYLVHTRQPARLLRELGPARFIGFHLYSGGLVLSALVFPIFCAMVVVEFWEGEWLRRPQTLTAGALWSLAIFNLVVAFSTSVIAAIIAAWRRKRAWLALGAPLMPIYWFLISIAAYRAVWQLATAPHHLWEKTVHRARTQRPRG